MACSHPATEHNYANDQFYWRWWYGNYRSDYQSIGTNLISTKKSSFYKLSSIDFFNLVVYSSTISVLYLSGWKTPINFILLLLNSFWAYSKKYLQSFHTCAVSSHSLAKLPKGST
jgi:hypothetical protein